VIYRPFVSESASHAHSLNTLEALYEYDDFMLSVGTLADMGCGSGLDLEWWATRTTRDTVAQPLDIKCLGIDKLESMSMAQKYKNIRYQLQDFEKPIFAGNRSFDVIWCHDAFQYVIDPFTTLRQWHSVLSKDGMMVIILPQTTNMDFHDMAYDQWDFCYYNWTMVSLIHVLAVSGFDCREGFFRKERDDPWLHAVVYKSEHEPMDPRTTTWYELAEKNLLPESATQSVNRFGHLRQRDLVLPWLDKSLAWLGQH